MRYEPLISATGASGGSGFLRRRGSGDGHLFRGVIHRLAADGGSACCDGRSYKGANDFGSIMRYEPLISATGASGGSGNGKSGFDLVTGFLRRRGSGDGHLFRGVIHRLAADGGSACCDYVQIDSVSSRV
jgi:hypothetical protein